MFADWYPDVAALSMRVLSTLGLGALVLWGFRAGGRVSGTVALLLAWGPLFLVWATEDDMALAGAIAFFWTGGPIGALAAVLKGTPPLAVRHFDRYLLPEDFPSDQALLLGRLQDAIDMVREASSILVDDLGIGQDDAWLREQEWSIANALVRCGDLQRDLDERRKTAVTDRVLGSLRPQQDALNAAMAAVAERIGRFERYAESASAASTTYRELQQCEDSEKRNDAYLDLLTTTVTEVGHRAELDGGNVRVLRESLEEQVKQTAAAGRWLIEAAGTFPLQPGDGAWLRGTIVNRQSS
ncbi:hypothetical protein GCM10009799_23310 [Nocardiopsis rhodophaea]|uniref:Integral membrane protein n=1 Tax=Nocardiopsis rhodophaea TaxID=280238 RepID=A0ABN2T2Q7_9ACTN